MADTGYRQGGLAWARACIGVDDRPGRRVCVRAERTRGGMTFTVLEPNDRPPAPNGDTPVAGVLTVRESLTRWVEAPFASRAKARKVFATLLDIQLPFPLEDCLHVMVAEAPTPSGAWRGLAAAARLEQLDARLTTLAADGLDPMVVDQEGLALWTQALVEAPPAADRPTRRAVVCLDPAGSTLAQGSGRTYLSAHPVRGDADADALRRLVTSADDADATREPTLWILAGGGAEHPETVAALRQALAPHGPVHVVDRPATFLARAVAARALGGGAYVCNLRTGPRTHPRLRARRRTRRLRAAGAVMAAGLLLSASGGLARAVLASRAHAARVRFQVAVDDLAGYAVAARGADAMRIVNEAVTERRASRMPLVRFARRSLTADLAAILAVAAEHDLRLESLSVDAGGVDLAGVAPDWTRPAALKTALEARGYEAALKRLDARADERIPFTITTGARHE